MRNWFHRQCTNDSTWDTPHPQYTHPSTHIPPCCSCSSNSIVHQANKHTSSVATPPQSATATTTLNCLVKRCVDDIATADTQRRCCRWLCSKHSQTMPNRFGQSSMAGRCEAGQRVQPGALCFISFNLFNNYLNIRVMLANLACACCRHKHRWTTTADKMSVCDFVARPAQCSASGAVSSSPNGSSKRMFMGVICNKQRTQTHTHVYTHFGRHAHERTCAILMLICGPESSIGAERYFGH